MVATAGPCCWTMGDQEPLVLLGDVLTLVWAILLQAILVVPGHPMVQQHGPEQCQHIAKQYYWFLVTHGPAAWPRAVSTHRQAVLLVPGHPWSSSMAQSSVNTSPSSTTGSWSPMVQQHGPEQWVTRNQ